MNERNPFEEFIGKMGDLNNLRSEEELPLIEVSEETYGMVKDFLAGYMAAFHNDRMAYVEGYVDIIAEIVEQMKQGTSLSFPPLMPQYLDALFYFMLRNTLLYPMSGMRMAFEAGILFAKYMEVNHSREPPKE